MNYSDFQTGILTSYTWIINYRNVYGEWDWIIDDVKKLGGQIRYNLMTTSYGYHAIIFHIKVSSMQSLHILKLKTDHYLNKQGWNSGDLNEYEKAETHIKFSDMRGRSGFKQIDRLRFLNFRNRRINKFRLLKTS